MICFHSRQPSIILTENRIQPVSSQDKWPTREQRATRESDRLLGLLNMLLFAAVLDGVCLYNHIYSETQDCY